MIYAILKLHSKQYIVKRGDNILIDNIRNTNNNILIFNSILCIFYKNFSINGFPYISEYKIEAIIVKKNIKENKIYVFKKKRRKGYHKKMGHRQKYTQIKINKIFKA